MRKDTDPKKRRRVAQAIGRGAELIRMRGWCIGALRDDSGRLCLMGAIEEASKNEPREIRYKAYDEVNKVLRRQNSSIHTWNDEQTSGERVADVLEVIAKGVDPSYQVEKICRHAEPACPDCGMSPGCYASDGYGGLSCRTEGWWNYGHKDECPQVPIIRKKLQEEKARAVAVSSS